MSLHTKSLAEMARDLKARKVSSEDLTRAFLERIEDRIGRKAVIYSGNVAKEEIQRLLEINCRGGNWKAKEDTSSSKKWDLNGPADASMSPPGSIASKMQKCRPVREILSPWKKCLRSQK